MLALCALVLSSTPAHADFGFVPGSFFADSFDPQLGGPDTQAGAHPAEATTDFRLNLKPGGLPDESLRNVRVDLPAGFVGNPEAVPTCSRGTLDAFLGTPGVACPVTSQVGVAVITIAQSGFSFDISAPVFNVAPRPGQVADFAFMIQTVLVHLVPVLDATGNYRISVKIDGISQGLPIAGSKVTLWGTPADTSHDSLRSCDGSPYISGYTCSVSSKRAAFLTNPTACAGPQTTTISADSWQRPGVVKTDSYTSASGVTGCDRLHFEPTADVDASTSAPDAPTGLSVDLTFPQNDDPDGLATPHLRTAQVTLPEGMTINPGSADGLSACTDQQLGLRSDSVDACPDGSKIGTATADTPLLPDQLTGSVYLRTQNSDDPASGEMFRLALVLEDKDRGVLIKIPGAVKVDETTGRIVTEFQDNPQTPVSHLSLQLKSGPRAPLASPPSCGEKTVGTQLSSWAGQTATLEPKLTVDCTAGLGGFSPSLTAGVAQPVGGAFSPFSVSIAKPDGNSSLSSLRLALPKGLLANLKGNLGTQVGTVRAFAGPGTNPYVLPGKVFLEGAYGDAPFSLRVVVPAVAGPFNLGEVVVRQKIYVDPETTQVTVVSDPIPTIVKGVPVRLQRLDVEVDKPGFMINPTSCAAKEVTGTLTSVAGQTAALTNRFQVGECQSLGFAPKLEMTMSGKGQTKDGAHPALTARLTPPFGNANSKKVTVTLPLSLALDAGNANGLCEPKDAAVNKCPAASIVGSAQARSILPDTLKGPVYFVRGTRLENGKVRKTLPKLFIPLTANGVTVNIHADSDVEDDRLVTTFDNLPDAPFSRFDLTINGGEHGILAVSGRNVCAATQIADARLAGQNGKSHTSKVTMGTPCALGVVKSSHTSTALKLTVGGLGAGKVSASGNGVAKVSRSLASATTATLTLKLTKATRRALARHRDVKVKVAVAF
ncbi:MAG: hypothetical protein ABW167_05945, partial [Baekduia sp.]